MRLTSPAYADGETMPTRFAAPRATGGRGLSVPLEWDGEPQGTRSFVLAMIDHHPVAHGWVHWLVVDLPAEVHALPEGASQTAAMPAGATELETSGHTPGYEGPMPPAGSGAHDYVITIHALDVARLDVIPRADWNDVRTAIDGHLLDSATLLGRFAL